MCLCVCHVPRIPYTPYCPLPLIIHYDSLFRLYRYSNWLLVLWIAQHMIKSRYIKIYHFEINALRGKSESIFQSIQIYSLSIWQLNCISRSLQYIFKYTLYISAFCILHIELCIWKNRESMFRGWYNALNIIQIVVQCSSPHI